MANLSGSLSTVNNITMFTEAATQYTAMCTKLQKQIPVIFGYVSIYDWLRERIAIAKEPAPPAASIAPITTELTALLSKPAAELTQNDLDKGINLMAKLPQSYGEQDFAKLPNNPANHWGQWQVFETRGRHPYLNDKQKIYGWPAKLYPNDPRGTGKVLVFNFAGQPDIDWMFQNAHTFGFVWYGPTINTWAYVGTATAFSDSYKKKAALGMASTIYHYFQDNQAGKEPASAADLTGFVDNIKSGTIPETDIPKWDHHLTKDAFDGYSNWATIYYTLPG